MIHETCTFQISYGGEPDTIKTFDFSESLSGVTGVIKEAYYILTGNSVSDITTIIHELGNTSHGMRTFSVQVIAEHKNENKVTLESIIRNLGFWGKV